MILLIRSATLLQIPGNSRKAAGGGTVFWVEGGELPDSLQARLLHVIQDERFEWVGGSRAIDADLRVIAATNSDIEATIRTGHFRLDLYYRLNIV